MDKCDKQLASTTIGETLKDCSMFKQVQNTTQCYQGNNSTIEQLASEVRSHARIFVESRMPHEHAYMKSLKYNYLTSLHSSCSVVLKVIDLQGKPCSLKRSHSTVQTCLFLCSTKVMDCYIRDVSATSAVAKMSTEGVAPPGHFDFTRSDVGVAPGRVEAFFNGLSIETEKLRRTRNRRWICCSLDGSKCRGTVLYLWGQGENRALEATVRKFDD